MQYRFKVNLPDEYKEVRKQYSEINFSKACRIAIIEYIKFYEKYHEEAMGCVWF